jgi:hypothetical protein
MVDSTELAKSSEKRFQEGCVGRLTKSGVRMTEKKEPRFLEESFWHSPCASVSLWIFLALSHSLHHVQAEGAAMGIVIGYGLLTWYPDPYRYTAKGVEVPKALDWRYVLRNLKAPVGYGAVTCGVYSGVECLFEGLRNQDPYTNPTSTYVNSAWGGAAAGIVLGSMSRRIDVMSVSALGVGLLMGMLEFNAHYKVSKQVSPETTIVQATTPVSVNTLKQKYPEYKSL